jgi:dimeric dUTPase (all-alpha-NTP-PPase superfamily)
MKKQIIEMLTLQSRMNEKVNPDWMIAGYPWHIAIWIECAELMDHYGWKWWKRQEPDIEQVKLELVDIWHFGLSQIISSEFIVTAETLLEDFELAIKEVNLDPEPFLSYIEYIAHDALNDHSFDRCSFFRAMLSIGMTLEELYKLYIGKNVLNFFRQDSGYKDGTYVKVWDGKEDNVHLMELLKTMSGKEDDFQTVLSNKLSELYKTIRS